MTSFALMNEKVTTPIAFQNRFQHLIHGLNYTPPCKVIRMVFKNMLILRIQKRLFKPTKFNIAQTLERKMIDAYKLDELFIVLLWSLRKN
jgi:hypothetical protein